MTAAEDAALARRLREAREFLGLSQGDVSEVLGIPRASVSQMEAGKRKVSAAELRELARLYRRAPEYFLTGEAEIASDDATMQALFRTTSDLTDTDRKQVLNFARFLRGAGPPPTDFDTEGDGSY